MTFNYVAAFMPRSSFSGHYEAIQTGPRYDTRLEAFFGADELDAGKYMDHMAAQTDCYYIYHKINDTNSADLVRAIGWACLTQTEFESGFEDLVEW